MASLGDYLGGGPLKESSWEFPSVEEIKIIETKLWKLQIKQLSCVVRTFLFVSAIMGELVCGRWYTRSSVLLNTATLLHHTQQSVEGKTRERKRHNLEVAMKVKVKHF